MLGLPLDELNRLQKIPSLTQELWDHLHDGNHPPLSMTYESPIKELIPNHFERKKEGSSLKPDKYATGESLFRLMHSSYEKHKKRVGSATRDAKIFERIKTYLLAPERKTNDFYEDGAEFFNLLDIYLTAEQSIGINENQLGPLFHAFNDLFSCNHTTTSLVCRLIALKQSGLFTPENWRLLYQFAQMKNFSTYLLNSMIERVLDLKNATCFFSTE